MGVQIIILIGVDLKNNVMLVSEGDYRLLIY